MSEEYVTNWEDNLDLVKDQEVLYQVRQSIAWIHESADLLQEMIDHINVADVKAVVGAEALLLQSCKRLVEIQSMNLIYSQPYTGEKGK